MGRCDLRHLDVAALLPIHRVADPLERLHRLAPRDDGESAQPGTSTTSSSMPGGIGSPWTQSPTLRVSIACWAATLDRIGPIHPSGGGPNLTSLVANRRLHPRR